MKKFILLLVAALMLCSCYGGKNCRVPIKEGDMRYTVTTEQIIVETCSFINGFGNPNWELVRVVYRKDDNTPIEFGGKYDKIVE